MAGCGNDMWPKHIAGNCDTWGPKDATAGSPFYTHCFLDTNSPETGKRPANEFPSVPYSTMDFHCERGLSSWNDPFQLNYGWLVGLTDLNTEKEYVQERIAAYFSDLIGIGFSGWRIDAAKHITPINLAKIFRKFKDRMGGAIPDDWITYLEIIIGGEAGLLMCNSNYYNFGKSFEEDMAREGLSQDDIRKVKIWDSTYPKEYPVCGYWVIKPERFAI